MNECPKCRGFGYTKGGPEGPWEKLDCVACHGTGKIPRADAGGAAVNEKLNGPGVFVTTDREELLAHIERLFDQLERSVAEKLAAAEERGRRRGVEEAKQATRDAIEEWDGKHRVGNIYVVVREALNALAPRDSGKEG